MIRKNFDEKLLSKLLNTNVKLINRRNNIKIFYIKNNNIDNDIKNNIWILTLHNNDTEFQFWYNYIPIPLKGVHDKFKMDNMSKKFNPDPLPINLLTKETWNNIKNEINPWND